MGKRKRRLSKKKENQKRRKTKDVNKVIQPVLQDLSPEALGRYDVFLNHRGPDVKDSFVSHLYDLLRVSGCNPFLDAKSLVKGEHALNAINEVLHGVRVSLAIFSKGYAESKYCLDELCNMMKTPEKVIPIFFGVDPEHLRHIENGPFATAFEKHLGKKRDRDVERWKIALLEASHLTGFRLRTFKDECALKKDIVARVLKAFGPTQLNHAQYPVGLEQSSKVVLDFLNQVGNVVGMVGITGVGGIGKTTLATHIYNEQDNFRWRSFLKDVKDANMANLKAKMVWDLLEEDMKKIGDYECCFRQIKKKKIFVVIDDIVKWSQFDELIPDTKDLVGGSRILITSRDQNLLNNVMRDAREKMLYEVEVLNPPCSLQLFMKSAFHEDIPSAKLHDLSRQIAGACGGLPLALEVIGGFLFDKRGDERLWYEAIKTLPKNKSILDCLKVSYNSLCLVEQEMFLDVAFFFVGAHKDVALEFWNSIGFFSRTYASLCTLIDRCLVKVDGNGLFIMHDLLRDMGCAIVVEKSPWNEGEQSHLCNPSSIIEFLHKNKGNEKVRGLSTNGLWDSALQNGVICEAKSFASLEKLHILILDDCVVDGDFSKWSRELRWLQWRRFHLPQLPSDLQLPNLTVLDLAYSNCLYGICCKDFDLQSSFPKLHVLILEGCTNLQELPRHIFELSSLKIINLKGCEQLHRLPRNIGQLENLRLLDMSECGVEELPMDFGGLQNLEEFNATRCFSLTRLPESFGDLSNLKILRLGWCLNLQRLCTSIVGLKKLTMLEMDQCGVEELPTDFGRLQSLEEFNANYCTSLTKLPDSFGEMSNLKILRLGWCFKLQRLCTSIGGLKKLIVLDIVRCGVGELPMDFGGLESLEDFNANECRSLTKLPESFGHLSNLKTLLLQDCTQLQRLCPSICQLKKLTMLDMSGSNVEELPTDFGELKSLEEFNANWCCSLTKLPKSFGNLSNLEALGLRGCFKLQWPIASISRFKKLTTLEMCEWGLEELPMDFGGLQSLGEVNANACSSPTKLPKSFGDLLDLKTLRLSGCHKHGGPSDMLEKRLISDRCERQENRAFAGAERSLGECNACEGHSFTKLSNSFGDLSNLETLELEVSCKLEWLSASIGGLKKLRIIDMRDCGVEELPTDFGRLQSLEIFCAFACNFLTKLPNSFGDLSNLKILKLAHCTQLQRLCTSIGGLKKLTMLDMFECGVEELPTDFGQLESLEVFNADECHSLTKLPDSFGDLSNLKTLDLYYCDKLESLCTSIGGLKKLTMLNMAACGVEELPTDFGQLESLEEFDAHACYSLTKLPESFGDLSNLKTLDLNNCCKLKRLCASIGGLKKLTTLVMAECGVEELPTDFGQLESLEEFNADECYSLTKLPESFGDLSNLKTLSLRRCRKLKRLCASIGGLKKLTTLLMAESGVEELPPDFGQLESLEEFNAHACYSLTKLPESFGDLSNLKILDL